MAQAVKGVRTTHPEYDRLSSLWEKCRHVVAGQSAMHQAGAKYLPKLKDETDDDYKARLARSDFFNGTWITLRAFSGMLFRKSPARDVPSGMEEPLKDVTMTGKTDEAFAKGLAHEALTITRFGVLVDHPTKTFDGKGNEVEASGKVVPFTKHKAETQGLRPKLALYTAETIINWREQEAGGNGQYKLVVLCEEHPVPEDEYSHKCEKRYRVLDLVNGQYRQRLFRVDKEGKDEQVGGDIYPLMNGKPLEEIPFRTYGADGEETECDEPALIDLVNANVAVYQINSDYRHGLHFTGLPTAVISGYVQENPADKLYIGSQAAWVFPDHQAKATFLEFTGHGLTELREAIREKKQEMAMAGARAIMDETKQVETLGGTQIKRNGENSALASVAISCSSAMEWSLTFFAKWSGTEAEITYQLNRDFLPTMIDAQTLTSLIAANQAGKLSDEELFDLMQRGDMIDAEIDFEEHQAKVEVTAPAPSRPAPRDPNAPKPGEELAA